VPKPPYDSVDVSTLAFWGKSAAERETALEVLRFERPVSWHRPAEGGLLSDPEDEGFWAITRHADIVHVSRHPDLFSSASGVMFDNIPEFLLEACSSFLAMDAPRHTLLRRLISSAFTPRQVARIDAQIAAQAGSIIDDLLTLTAQSPGTPFDFMEHVAGRLPMWTISEMVGIPAKDRSAVAASANEMVGWNDAATLAGREPLGMLMEAMLALHAAARNLATQRRIEPTDDLMSALVLAEVDGQRLTDDELSAFFVLLAVAGNDTTKNSIAHGVLALSQHPGASKMLTSDFDGRVSGAVEEMFRWASPVMTFRRTATDNCELSGVKISKGDKVVMFYAAANHDPTVFPDPDLFDITRSPNLHLGFGGGGPHFCMGASLARTQIKCLLRELHERAPELEFGPPVFQVGNFIHGIRSLPCIVKTPATSSSK
jgi:cytochrome P450